MLQPSSLTSIKQLAPQLGFELVSTNHIGAGNSVAEVILRKTSAPDLPDWLRDCI
jgi:hypothetical protein